MPVCDRAVARAAALLAASLLSGACSFDYGQASLGERLSEDLPNTVLENFEHTVVQDGKPIFRLMAARAETYDTRKETRLREVSFVEYDQRDGQAVTAGRADSAVFFSDTEDAELSGSISFYSKRSGAGLEGGYLYWDAERKVLEGRRDRLITITRDDGSSIRGEGFSADARHRSVSFTGRTSGSIVVADEESGGGADEDGASAVAGDVR
jgi:LPS export ABC transporter protein LptC